MASETLKTMKEKVKLYTTMQNKDRGIVKKLLELKEIPYKEVNVKQYLAFLERDLDIKRLPALITSEGIFSGVNNILKYLNISKEVYFYLKS